MAACSPARGDQWSIPTSSRGWKLRRSTGSRDLRLIAGGKALTRRVLALVPHSWAPRANARRATTTTCCRSPPRPRSRRSAHASARSTTRSGPILDLPAPDSAVECLLYLVADYGHEDGAFIRLSQRLGLIAPRIRVVLAQVPPCDTVAAGYCVAHLALIPRPDGRVVAHDVGLPGGDDARLRPLCIGRTATGATVLGPNSGYAWSFVADHVSGPCYLEVPAEAPHCGPERVAAAVVRAMRCHPHAVTGVVPRREIPPPPATATALAAGVERLASRFTSPCEPNRLAHRPPLGFSPASRPAAAGSLPSPTAQLCQRSRSISTTP